MKYAEDNVGHALDMFLESIILETMAKSKWQKGRLGEGNLIFLVRTVGRIILSGSVG